MLAVHDSFLGGGRRGKDDWGIYFCWAVMLWFRHPEFGWLDTIAKSFVFAFYDVLHNIAVGCHCVK